jgi:hypothetical protein
MDQLFIDEVVKGCHAISYAIVDKKQRILRINWESKKRRFWAWRVVEFPPPFLDFNGQTTAGLGPLSYEAQRGLYLHPTFAVPPEREPLGVTDTWMWAWQPKATDGKRPGVR